MPLDVAHRRRNLRRGKRGCARLQQRGLVALHELDQQQLKQPRHDLGACCRRLQELAQHLLHIPAHAAAVARTEMHVPAMIGLVVKCVEQELRDGTCGRKALLQTAAQHRPRNDNAQHQVMLAELVYGMRAGGIEQKYLVLGERELRTIDNLWRAPSIDIADFDIIVHVLRHGVKARVAHNRQALGHTFLVQGVRRVTDFMDMPAIDICLLTLSKYIVPVIAGARAVSALAVGQLEQKIVQTCDIHSATIVDLVIFCRGFDISRAARTTYSDFNRFKRLVLEEWVWQHMTTMCFRSCGSRAKNARRLPNT